ncbi:MAG: helix-turn-helix transcriptional regulator [Kosmotogaceae bacterium]
MNLIRSTRVSSKYTQKQLSEAIGKDQKYISAVENKRIMPPFNIADNISRVLDVPVELLFPKYVRTSPFPRWVDLMYLKTLGLDMCIYFELIKHHD